MKPQLLETSRLFLAIERAADLGSEGIGVEELAQEFGLTRQAIEAFLGAIEDSNDDGGSPDELVDFTLDDDGHLCVHFAPGLDREVPLSGDEVTALLIGLDRLGLAEEQSRDLSDLLLARLSADQAEAHLRLRGRLAVQAQHRWRPEIEAALESGDGLRILYRSDSSERAWRHVQPSALVDHGGQLYLGAWCFERSAARTFRSDRIEAIEPCPGQVVVDQPQATGMRRRLESLSSGERYEAIVLRCVDADGRWMARERFGQQLRIDRDRIRLYAFPGQSLANWIVACAGSMAVESPPALVDLVRQRARQMRAELGVKDVEG